MKIRNLAVKVATIGIVVCKVFLSPVYAGIPVIDGTNLSQNVISAYEEVAQTLQQIDQYSTQVNQYVTQIQQYDNMLQNTLAPVSYLWNKANATVNNLMGTYSTIKQMQARAGNLSAFMDKFKNAATYQNSPCFSQSTCSQSQWNELANSRILGSESQKLANDASLQSLAQQQDALQNDASNLEQLQSGAQGATGQMQALGYGNQLAASNGNQLLQIRGLLIAQQNAMTARNQALADKEAQELAATAYFRSGAMDKSASNNSWHFH